MGSAFYKASYFYYFRTKRVPLYFIQQLIYGTTYIVKQPLITVIPYDSRTKQPNKPHKRASCSQATC